MKDQELGEADVVTPSGHVTAGGGRSWVPSSGTSRGYAPRRVLPDSWINPGSSFQRTP